MPPDYNAACIMRDIDGMSKQWRALVHEYGYRVVSTMRDGGMSIKQADDALWLRRSNKQAEWLATNYITAKTAHNYFA
jgi:hypothetical protein